MIKRLSTGLLLSSLLMACSNEKETPMVVDPSPEQLQTKLSLVTRYETAKFDTTVDKSKVGPLDAGQSYKIDFNIAIDPVFPTEMRPRLTFATSILNSNDWFIAPKATDGLDITTLLKNDTTMDVTDLVAVWDAGTEADEALGLGTTQGINQEKPNTGEKDSNATVRLVDDQNASEYAQVLLIKNSETNYSLVITSVVDAKGPLSPGALAVFSGEQQPLFFEGTDIKAKGLEALAEDGNPTPLYNYLTGSVRLYHLINKVKVAGQGIYEESDKGTVGSLQASDSYTITFTLQPEEKIYFASMLVASNDWFIAPTSDKGLNVQELLDEQVVVDITDQITVWDAGTEADEKLGEGKNQGINQEKPETGDSDKNSNVRKASVLDKDENEIFEKARKYVSVILSKISETEYTLEIRSAGDTPSPISAGVFTKFTGDQQPFFVANTAVKMDGLEKLAEDGEPKELFNTLSDIEDDE